MKALIHLEKIIEPYKPLKDLETIIVETNKIFHSFDANHYDEKHPEIFEQLPSIYKNIFEYLPKKKLKILDFGCGTGFEATQIIDNLDIIELLVCYDISPEMLAICKKKLSTAQLNNKIKFVDNLEMLSKEIKFDLLITNSLLHHLPKPFEMIKKLTPLLNENCYYIMGHEGSIRFFKNNEIREINNQFNEKKKKLLLKKMISIRKYFYYLKIIGSKLKKSSNIYIKTAAQVVKDGLFKVTPSVDVIDRIIDIYVSHDINEANNGRGFDFKKMDFNLEWDLIYSKTYGFLGQNDYKTLNEEEKIEYKRLENLYPDDGLNFCCLWKKKNI